MFKKSFSALCKQSSLQYRASWHLYHFLIQSDDTAKQVGTLFDNWKTILDSPVFLVLQLSLE